MSLSRATKFRAIIAMLLATVASAAQATTITLQQGTASYTGHLDVQVRNDGTNAGTSFNQTANTAGYVPPGASAIILRSLHTWDLSSVVPEGATITSVSLALVHRADTGASIADVDDPLTIGFNEATENDPADPLYILRTISAPITEPAVAPGNSTTAGSNWNNTFGAGMTLGGSVLSSANVDPEVAGAGAVSYRTDTFASSAAFVAAAQAALDSVSNQLNFALLLANESGTGRIAPQFGSNSSGYATLPDSAPPRPILTIEYTEVPEPTTFGLLGVCAIVMLGRRRCGV